MLKIKSIDKYYKNLLTCMQSRYYTRYSATTVVVHLNNKNFPKYIETKKKKKIK